MPRDKRLYMTYPIDFCDHPKIEQLSDSAFRAFVSMNGYSRQHRLDGRIPAAVAVKKWKPRVLAELVASDPTRPLLVRETDAFLIRDYAEHQFTTSDEEELREKRAAAGAKGGKAKASAVALAKQTAGKSVAESESRSGLLTDVTTDTESSHLPERASSGPDSASAAATLLGIRDLEAVRLMLEATSQSSVTRGGAVELSLAIVSKSKQEVRDVDAYLATVCRNSAAEVQQAYFDLDIEGIP